MRVLAYLAVVFCLVSCGTEASAKEKTTFLPENNLHLEDFGFSGNGMTKEIFDSAIAQAQKVFEPIVAKFGARLVIKGNWSDSTVNAYASQRGNEWSVQMFGGLARRSEVTPDGFLMVIGHELGHHKSGFPFYGPYDWASAEGQSDVFAAHGFAKKIWQSMKRIKNTREAAFPEIVVEMCNNVYDSVGEANLCYRSLAASMSLAQLLRALNNDGPVYYDRPDRTIVRKTNVSYPRTVQSRLDSMIAGALCPIRWDYTKIPKTEEESSKVFCTDGNGYGFAKRPASWFKANF
jgi:hypothetical protein